MEHVDTLLSAGGQIALTVALADVVKRAVAMGNPAMSDAFGPLIAVLMGVAVALCSAPLSGQPLQNVVLLGLANGVAACYGYRYTKAGGEAVAAKLRVPVRRHARVREPHPHVESNTAQNASASVQDTIRTQNERMIERRADG